MQQVGRYQIVGELGRGAMGVVYKAQDPAIGRTIAIKSIRLNDLTDDSERARLRERLFREAQSAGILSHPNIVTIYDIAEENGMAYIFMECVNGPPLEKILRAEQATDKATLLSIFRQTAGALDYAHKKGIIHRDIKPANIMIHDDGTAKITDFGVAKIMSQQMTQAGTMMGTPSYMSPEQVQGLPITGRADQFSLAVIAYEVLTGEKPFIADYMPTLLFKIVREEPVSPQRLNTTLGPRVEATLRKGLAKLPEDRYHTCVEFIDALAAACNENPSWIPLPRGVSQDMPTVGSSEALVSTVPPAPTADPVPWQRPETKPPSNVVRNVMIAAATLLVVFGGLYATMKRPHQPQHPNEATATSPALPDPPPPQVEAPSPVPQSANAVAVKAVASKAVASQAVPSKAPAIPEESPFELTSVPTGASAVFDNNPDLACTTPCKLNLPVGRHTIELGRGGYRGLSKMIEVPRDPGLIVDLVPLEGTFNLVTNPPGLRIVIDGKEHKQKTPLSVILPQGAHQVAVLNGSDRRDFTIEIKDGQLKSQTVEWGQ